MSVCFGFPLSQKPASPCFPSPSSSRDPSFQKLLRELQQKAPGLVTTSLPEHAQGIGRQVRRAWASVRVVRARARARRVGLGGSLTMKGTGFFSPHSQSSVVAQARWGNSLDSEKAGEAGPGLASRCSARLRTVPALPYPFSSLLGVACLICGVADHLGWALFSVSSTPTRGNFSLLTSY